LEESFSFFQFEFVNNLFFFTFFFFKRGKKESCQIGEKFTVLNKKEFKNFFSSFSFVREKIGKTQKFLFLFEFFSYFLWG
jgi:hypothetical protein